MYTQDSVCHIRRLIVKFVMEGQIETTVQNLNNQLDRANPAYYGNASITIHEIHALKKLWKGFIEQGVLPDQVRDKIREHVIEHGFPEMSGIGIKALGAAAFAHACTVVASLVQERLPKEGLDPTFRSYTTKNRADRYFIRLIVEHNPNLLSAWLENEKRDPTHTHETVRYPENVSNNEVHGVTNSDRYFIACMLKNLEDLRKGRTKPDWQYDREIFKIPWDTFIEDIKNAESIYELPVLIAIRVAAVFLERGVAGKDIAQIIHDAYNPQNAIIEHGDLYSVREIWTVLLAKLFLLDINEDDLAGLYYELWYLLPDGFVGPKSS